MYRVGVCNEIRVETPVAPRQHSPALLGSIVASSVTYMVRWTPSYGSKNRSLTTTTRPGGASICAFSAVEGMWAVRADRVVLRWLDECDSQRRLFDPTEPLLLRGGGLQTTRPNFRVAVLLKYRSNAHDVVEGTYADDPGPIGSLRKLLGDR